MNQVNSYYLQPLGIERTFSRVCHIFGHAWATFLGISFMTGAVAFGAVLLSLIVMGAGGYALAQTSQYHGNDPYFVNEFAQVFMASAFLVEILLIYMFQCIADAAIVRGVAELYAGYQPSMLACFFAAWRKGCHLLCSFLIVVFLMILLPFCLLVWILRPAIEENNAIGPLVVTLPFFAAYVGLLALLTYVMYPVIMIENNNPLAAIGRSIALVMNHKCYTLCTLFLWWIVKMIINVGVTGLTSMWRSKIYHNYHYNNYDAGDGYYNNGGDYSYSDTIGNVPIDATFGSVGDGLLSFLVGIILSTMDSIFQAVIYFNNRIKTEGLELETLRFELGVPHPLTLPTRQVSTSLSSKDLGDGLLTSSLSS